MSDLLKWGLIGVGGYMLYNYFTAPAPAAASSAAVPAAGATANPPASTSTTPTLVQQLTAAAQSDPSYIQQGGKMSADQWNYYYQRMPGRSPLLSSVNDALFYPNGRIGDAPLLTATQYVAAIATQGLSGLGLTMPRVLTVPALNAIRRGAVERGSHYVPRNQSMVGGRR